MTSETRNNKEERCRVQWECTACEYLFTSVLGEERRPKIPLCPICGEDWVYPVKIEPLDEEPLNSDE